MSQRKSPVALFAVVATLALLGGCEWPTRSAAKLNAIKAEAQMLMKASAKAVRLSTAFPLARIPSGRT
jgi:hypothetical protein